MTPFSFLSSQSAEKVREKKNIHVIKVVLNFPLKNVKLAEGGSGKMMA